MLEITQLTLSIQTFRVAASRSPIRHPLHSGRRGEGGVTGRKHLLDNERETDREIGKRGRGAIDLVYVAPKLRHHLL